SNLKRVVAPSGLLIVTTRSRGYPFHAAPFDYWRYEVDDIKVILADMELVEVVSDTLYPGVLACVRKPAAFRERSTSEIQLWSIVTGRRQPVVTGWEELRLRFSSPRRIVSTALPAPVRRAVWRWLPSPIARELRKHRQAVPRVQAGRQQR